jgi:hypothetical protein
MRPLCNKIIDYLARASAPAAILAAFAAGFGCQVFTAGSFAAFAGSFFLLVIVHVTKSSIACICHIRLLIT